MTGSRFILVALIASLSVIALGCSTWTPNKTSSLNQRQASIPAFKPLMANPNSQSAMNAAPAIKK